MTKEWTETNLGEIATYQNGYAFKPKDLTGQGRPVVRIKQLLDPAAIPDLTDIEVPERFELDNDDLVFSWSGTLASVIWDRGPAYLNQHLFRVTERPGVSRRWLHLCLDNAIKELNEKTHGTTMKHITKKTLEAHKVMLPPQKVQDQIANIVGALDDVTASIDAENQNLTALYGDAAKLLWTTNDGGEAPSRMLGDVITLDVARTSMDPDSEYRLAGVLNAGKGLVDKGTFRGLDTEYAAMNTLRAGYLVMRKLTAWEGPITVVPDEFDGYVASNEFPTFCLSGEVSSAWLKHVCRTPRLRKEMKNRVTGTVQRRKRLNPDQLLTVALPIPARPDQEKAAAALESLDSTITALRDEVEALRSYRAGFLSGLLNREIEVPDLEEEMT